MASNAKVGSNNALKKLLFFLFFLLLVVYFFWQSIDLSWLEVFNNQEKISVIIKDLGYFGPLAIIFLIAIAIIISPLPSAPVAIISGALYGHTLGAIYVVLGALVGALTAFSLARKFGREFVSHKIQSHLPVKVVGSQNILMLIVFVTRLAPFVSFDVISYAAGLTRLSWPRFFIATLLGIIPVSFFLAHFGSQIGTGEIESIALAIIVLALFIIVPLVVNIFKNKMKD